MKKSIYAVVFAVLCGLSTFSYSAVDLSDSILVLKSCPGYSGLYGGPCPAEPGEIFSIDFDSMADWTNDPSQRCRFDGDTGCDLPTGIDFLYSGEQWHPNTTPGSNPSIVIDSTGARGGTGKGFTQWDESHGSASQWGSDGLLYKTIEPVNHVWVSVWVKFSSTWQWEVDGSGNEGGMGKVFRVMRYIGDGTDSRFQYFSNGFTAPIIVLDIKYAEEFAGPVRGRIAYRCAPLPDNYDCPSLGSGNEQEFIIGSETRAAFDVASTNPSSWAGGLGDGNWHQIEMEVKINSAPSVSDGVARVYVDSQLEYEKTDLNILHSGASINGLNASSVGGNWNNVWSAEINEDEQFLQFDDWKTCAVERCQ